MRVQNLLMGENSKPPAGHLIVIRARAIVMPCDSDLYFRVHDNQLAVELMPYAELRPISSIWGHAAAFGVNPPDDQVVDAALRELLGS